MNEVFQKELHMESRVLGACNHTYKLIIMNIDKDLEHSEMKVIMTTTEFTTKERKSNLICKNISKVTCTNIK